MNYPNKMSSYKQLFNLIGILLFLSFAGGIMLVFRKMFFGSTRYNFLLWNLFLAWIPLLVSLLINYLYVNNRPGLSRFTSLFLLSMVWIGFYPNAPYIITDFVHLSGIQYYLINVGYSMNAIIWYDFILVALFILTGFLTGFVSLYLVHMLITDKFNKIVGWLFSIFILFLSAFGVYLGRFIRWNSWDIVFTPHILAKSLGSSFNDYAIGFTFSFGLFLILIYCALYYLTNLNDYKIAFLIRAKE